VVEVLKHDKSHLYLDEAKKYLAGGVSSSSRINLGKNTLFIRNGKGSRIYDVDGNEYIDYILAWGPLILGHAPESVAQKVKEQIDLGTIFGEAYKPEFDLAKRVCEIFPSIELIRFTNSSSEAVQMCFRLARAFTKKEKILKFEGAYHGWYDDELVSVHPKPSDITGDEKPPKSLPETLGQRKGAVDEVLVAPWNRIEMVKQIIQKESSNIAAIIVEPIMCNNGVILPKTNFLESLREITKNNDILLIFDETITGFRVSLGGAQEYYNISPDLTVFGKGMGGGYPIAGYGGKAEIMELIAHGKVNHSGTYNANAISVVGALATIEELSKDKGAIYNRITNLGQMLMNGIEKIFIKNDLPITIQGPGPFFSALFTDKPVETYRETFNINLDLYEIFWQKLLDNGIRIWQSGRGLWYISAAHTKEDIEITLNAVKKVVKELK